MVSLQKGNIIVGIGLRVGYGVIQKGQNKIYLWIRMIEQKALFFNHDFGYSFPLFSSLLIKEGRRKGEWITKVVFKTMPFCSINKNDWLKEGEMKIVKIYKASLNPYSMVKLEKHIFALQHAFLCKFLIGQSAHSHPI